MSSFQSKLSEYHSGESIILGVYNERESCPLELAMNVFTSDLRTIKVR